MNNTNNSPSKYTVAKHPDAKLKGQLFKWAVLMDGKLFEGFVTREDAERAAAEYNEESK